MNQTPSIDITNGKGCNIDLWTRDNLVLRITPRHNDDVNDYWMPDAGRSAYKIFNENRISRPSQKLDNEKVQSSWNNAFATLAEQIDGTNKEDILFVGSPHSSVEENYLLMRLSNLLAGSTPVFTPHIIDGAGDDFLLTDDQAPNTNGCRLLGLDELEADKLAESIKSAKLVILLNDNLVDRNVVSGSDLENAFVAMFGTNNTETAKHADLVIPITTAAEHAASYVNVDKRIQRTVPAKETKYSNRRLDIEMSEGRLDRYGTSFDNWVTEENKVDCLPLWSITNQLADNLGLDIKYASSRDILSEVADKVPAFSGVSYQAMDENSGIDLTATTNKVKS
jgi:NADH-quinone oxidoreductase subunit G